MNRSLIEMMVDKACGFDATVERQVVTLRCPKCKLEKQGVKEDDDPEGTRVVEIHCPECIGGDFDSAVYLDENENELNYDPQPTTQENTNE